MIICDFNEKMKKKDTKDNLAFINHGALGGATGKHELNMQVQVKKCFFQELINDNELRNVTPNL